MRWLGRLVGLILLLLAGWLASLYLARFDISGFLRHDKAAWKLEMVPQATIAVSYIAESQRWLSFPVPSGAQRFKLISNGNLRDLDAAKAKRALDTMQRWQYALEIELVDSKGKVLLHRQHHHRSNFAAIRDPAGRSITPAYYLSETLTPINGVVVNFDLTGLPPASRLRVRLVEADPDLADVVVRAYFPESNDEARIAILWKRLSEKQKMLLAKGSVYNAELLQEDERRNLVRNLWQPAGPLGARGVDFLAREMYVLRDTEGEPEAEPILPAGIIGAPGQLAVFTVPEQGAELHFSAQPLPGLATPPVAPMLIKGRWYGNSTFARENFTLSWTDSQHFMTRKFAGGLIELEPPVPLALRAFIESNGQKIEITPERSYKRLFLPVDQPIRFTIAHDAQQPTPLRLEARRLLPSTAGTPAQLHYVFLDAQGKILKEDNLSLHALPARYDQVVGEPVGTLVSDFTEAYFSAPAAAVELQLSSVPPGGTDGILVALFNRPNTLPREIRTPEDQFASVAQGEKIPAWFALRPQNYERLVIENRSRLLLVQTRPMEDKPEIQAGLFDWEDFRPRGPWLARQLLVPRDPAVPVREEALVTTYTPLRAGQVQTLEFPSYLGVQQLTPSLLLIRDDDGPIAATVWLDGRVHHRFRSRGRYSETRLPPLPAGRHRLQIALSDNKPSQLLINHVRPASLAYSTHIASRMDKELVYDIDRTSSSEETLSARLFQPIASSMKGERSRLRVRIEGPKPLPLSPQPGWLFNERIFDIRPDPSFAAPVFDTQGQRSDAGRPAFIPFPANAARGRYRLRITLENGPPGYLALSRLTPGVAVQRRILEEPEASHAVDQ